MTRQLRTCSTLVKDLSSVLRIHNRRLVTQEFGEPDSSGIMSEHLHFHVPHTPRYTEEKQIFKKESIPSIYFPPTASIIKGDQLI